MQDSLFAVEPKAPISAFTGKPVARARTTDPTPSHEAAAKVDVTKGQSLVLRAALFGRGTADQLRMRILQHGDSISPSGTRTRCKELCDAGLLYVVAHFGGHAVYDLTPEGERTASRIKYEAQKKEAA